MQSLDTTVVFERPMLANRSSLFVPPTLMGGSVVGDSSGCGIDSITESSPMMFPEAVDKAFLAVEDNKLTRRMVCRLLARRGFSYDACENGEQCVARVLGDGKTYGAILLDNQMPVMTGIEAVQKLREGGYRGLVVGLTADALEHQQHNFLGAGVDILLTKPLTAAKFDSFVEQFTLDRYSKHTRPPLPPGALPESARSDTEERSEASPCRARY
jgi:CheY-like chemotaxis protein